MVLTLIVLGMDNTGKTTLCGQLSKELNIRIVNSLGPNATKWDMENFIQYKMGNDDTIFERFCFFEEMVYGSILRNYSKFNFNDPIFKTIKNFHPIIIKLTILLVK